MVRKIAGKELFDPRPSRGSMVGGLEGKSGPALENVFRRSREFPCRRKDHLRSDGGMLGMQRLGELGAFAAEAEQLGDFRSVLVNEEVRSRLGQAEIAAHRPPPSPRQRRLSSREQFGLAPFSRVSGLSSQPALRL